jgi:YegS/Rv2252/BmrU family lipid kinase
LQVAERERNSIRMPPQPDPDNKIFLIVNPHAGGGAVGRQWARIQALVRERLGPVRFDLTRGPGDATRLARAALHGGAEVLVCVGGDGTLNEIVTGMMGETGPLRPDARLGLIPLGTGCDFIRSVRIPRDPREAVAVIAAGSSETVDLGRISFKDHQDRQASRYFLNVASFGLGGEVDARVGKTGKFFGGFLSFIWATLASVVTYRQKTVHVRVDDSPEETFTAMNVVIANGQYHGGGMWVAPQASLSDGLFHVTVIGEFSLPEVLWHLPKLYNGKLFQLAKVRCLTGRRVEARSQDRVLLDVDGEQPGVLPATVEIVPSAIRIIVPPHDVSAPLQNPGRGGFHRGRSLGRTD